MDLDGAGERHRHERLIDRDATAVEQVLDGDPGGDRNDRADRGQKLALLERLEDGHASRRLLMIRHIRVIGGSVAFCALLAAAERAMEPAFGHARPPWKT